MTALVQLASPFGQENLEEIPLPRAPLARTLTQIRFPNQSSLATGDEVVNELAKVLKPSYPVLNDEQAFGFLLTPDGVERRESGARIRRLGSPDETWQVSFATNFMSLETTAYTSRNDFCERLSHAWQQFTEVVGAPSVQRIGFRYINRVSDRPFLDNLAAMVRPEVMGSTFAGAPSTPIARSISENLYVRNEEDRLLARWGILPPGETFDPAIPQLPDVSWIFDLDSFREFSKPAVEGLDVPAIVKELGRAAYRYFRWAVTPDFLRFFGAELQ